MPLAFPLSRAAFLERLPIEAASFAPLAQHEVANLASGEVLKTELAPPLWQGAIQLAPMTMGQADEVQALLVALEVPGASFDAYHPHRAGPALDPAGVTLGAAAPVIASVNFSAATIGVAGLPAGYVLSAGDLVCFEYGTSPPRRALHRVTETATADAAGAIAALALTPGLRPGATAGAALTLVRAYCRAILMPGGVNYGTSRARIVSGMSFEFRQTLRG